MSARILLIGLMSLWFRVCTATDPTDPTDPRPLDHSAGIVVQIRTSALNVAGEYAVKQLLSDYIRSSIAGMNRTEGCKFGSCFLQNFNVIKYVAPTSRVTIKPGIGVVWTLLGAELSFRFDLDIETSTNNGVAYVKGSANVQMKGLSLTTEFTLDRGFAKRLDIAVTKCSVDVRSFDNLIVITNKTDNSIWFSDVINEELNGYLKSRVNESVTAFLVDWVKLVSQMVPDGLSRMNADFESSAGFFLNDSLVTDPQLDGDIIELIFYGVFQTPGNEFWLYAQPRSFFSPPPDTSSVIAVYAYQQVTSTLCDVLYRTGWLRINVTKDLLPLNYQNYHNLFDTACDNPLCFGKLFPEISKQFPDASVKFVIGPSMTPDIEFYGKLFVPNVYFNLDVVIQRMDGSEKTVMKLSVRLRMPITAFAFNKRVVGGVYAAPLTIDDRGTPNEFAPYLPRASFVLQNIVDFILVPWFNFYGAIGFSLFFPNGIRFVNTHIWLNARGLRHDDGASRFRTDIVYDSEHSTRDDIALYFRHLSSLMDI